ncbi:hypothetical protein NDU88_005373 [Pleurodeles waltl]|uniref:Uncharacterized protein n=1 Tax=Pleurodeles waltl TaxID=8319 RepID=A0AAV7QIT7_PLEWA|nr:hypothetical protein NDU88_005373 [Pleurodeles waltl]
MSSRKRSPTPLPESQTVSSCLLGLYKLRKAGGASAPFIDLALLMTLRMMAIHWKASALPGTSALVTAAPGEPRAGSPGGRVNRKTDLACGVRRAACAAPGAGRPAPGAEALAPDQSVSTKVSGDCRHRALVKCAAPERPGAWAAARRVPDNCGRAGKTLGLAGPHTLDSLGAASPRDLDAPPWARGWSGGRGDASGPRGPELDSCGGRRGDAGAVRSAPPSGNLSRVRPEAETRPGHPRIDSTRGTWVVRQARCCVGRQPCGTHPATIGGDIIGLEGPLGARVPATRPGCA